MKKNFLYDKVVIEFNKKTFQKDTYIFYSKFFNFNEFSIKDKINFYYKY